ncbi:MAG: methionyl-tRNA formyltransferase [Myxococcota bacterium]|nr:methionyl-tRNA formyltransferase [Myxococcota bacterium]
MRILFFGTPDFAVTVLDALVESGHEIVCVVAQPDKPKGRGRKLVSPPTVQRARSLGIPTKQPRAVRRGPFVEWATRECEADVGVVVAYGRILIQELLDVPLRGCINVHASLLPKYRGAAPIQWSIIEGESETGVCTMQMDAGLDTGDVLLRRATPILDDDTGPVLWARLAELGAALMVETLERLDEITPSPQDDAAATHAPMLAKADGVLDWSGTAKRLHDRVRGVNPWPSGQTTLRGDLLKIHRTRLAPDVSCEGAEPGAVLATSPRLLVACGTGSVEILEAQLPGKPRRPARDIVNGARLQVGEVLGA